MPLAASTRTSSRKRFLGTLASNHFFPQPNALHPLQRYQYGQQRREPSEATPRLPVCKQIVPSLHPGLGHYSKFQSSHSSIQALPNTGTVAVAPLLASPSSSLRKSAY
ncbi:expressed unknown protein [Seminavis robusta]|uniref:Uncharacterized protein n=1 Tax=Seminavis robusta TaxID=568900 RepID=A0A9N8E6V1_9STRA|nr:expressed unknown protein [Seminavis robusta]|eukprot:Sro726_g193431.1  (108) ;mRNA; f:14987-15310